MGDWNAKVGDQQDGEEGVVGYHKLHGEKSENGERFNVQCASNMVIATTLFPIRISTSTHWYHQTHTPKTRSIMWLSVESLEDQF